MQRGVGAVWVRGAYLWHAVALSFGDPGTTSFVPGYGQVHPLRGAVVGSMMAVLGMDVCAIGGRGGAIGGECGVLSRGLTACHRLRGGDVYCGLGCPRMSPTSGSAKYGATHGCHHLPGWLKCPPLVIVSAVGGEADSALRPTTALRGCTFGTHYICIV